MPVEIIGRSVEDVLEGETGGLMSIAITLNDLGSALYAAGETFRYDEGEIAAEFTRRVDDLAAYVERLSLTSEGVLTGNRECRACSGDGKDWGLQEPERSMNPCPDCNGTGVELEVDRAAS